MSYRLAAIPLLIVAIAATAYPETHVSCCPEIGLIWDGSDGPRNGVWGDEGDSIDETTAIKQVDHYGSRESRLAVEFSIPDEVTIDRLVSATFISPFFGSGYVTADGPPVVEYLAYAADGDIGYGDAEASGTVVGSTPTIDVTSVVEDLLDAGASHMGMRIRISSSGNAYVKYYGQGFQLVFELEDNSPPTADAGDDILEECDGTSTTVTLSGSGSSDPDGDALSFEWIAPEGSGVTIATATSAVTTASFPVGNTLMTLKVTDANGEVDFDDVLVTIEDTVPAVAHVTPDVFSLWPPNRKMVSVQLVVRVTDECDTPEDLEVVVTVSSSEPDGAVIKLGDVDGEDGYTSPVSVTMSWDSDAGAWVGEVDLRAERESKDGRIYTVAAEVEDASGNISYSEAVVLVPFSQGRNK